MEIDARLEQARKLVDGLHEDASQILGLIEMAIPLPQAIVKRLVERCQQFKNIVNTEDKKDV
jgi:hypothetical protein